MLLSSRQWNVDKNDECYSENDFQFRNRKKKKKEIMKNSKAVGDDREK